MFSTRVAQRLPDEIGYVNSALTQNISPIKTDVFLKESEVSCIARWSEQDKLHEVLRKLDDDTDPTSGDSTSEHNGSNILEDVTNDSNSVCLKTCRAEDDAIQDEESSTHVHAQNSKCRRNRRHNPCKDLMVSACYGSDKRQHGRCTGGQPLLKCSNHVSRDQEACPQRERDIIMSKSDHGVRGGCTRRHRDSMSKIDHGARGGCNRDTRPSTRKSRGRSSPRRINTEKRRPNKKGNCATCRTSPNRDNSANNMLESDAPFSSSGVVAAKSHANESTKRRQVTFKRSQSMPRNYSPSVSHHERSQNDRSMAIGQSRKVYTRKESSNSEATRIRQRSRLERGRNRLSRGGSARKTRKARSPTSDNSVTRSDQSPSNPKPTQLSRSDPPLDRDSQPRSGKSLTMDERVAPEHYPKFFLCSQVETLEDKMVDSESRPLVNTCQLHKSSTVENSRPSRVQDLLDEEARRARFGPKTLSQSNLFGDHEHHHDPESPGEEDADASGLAFGPKVLTGLLKLDKLSQEFKKAGRITEGFMKAPLVRQLFNGSSGVVHDLVNKERIQRGLTAYERNFAMDKVAQAQADLVASSAVRDSTTAAYIGHVLRGSSIEAIHESTMSMGANSTARTNILSLHFTKLGVGYAQGTDGVVYLCQLFAGGYEVSVVDTMQNSE